MRAAMKQAEDDSELIAIGDRVRQPFVEAEGVIGVVDRIRDVGQIFDDVEIEQKIAQRAPATRRQLLFVRALFRGQQGETQTGVDIPYHVRLLDDAVLESSAVIDREQLD